MEPAEAMFDPRNILSITLAFHLSQRMSGGYRVNRFLCDAAKIKSGERILDIGCGTADILDFLPPVEYYGFDLNRDYIAWAQRKFGSRGRFSCETVSSEKIPPELENNCDVVVAKGVLHHLNEDEVSAFFRLVKKTLRKHGRMFTLDACYTKGQGGIGKWLVSKDRGQFVRNDHELLALAKKSLGDSVQASTHDNLYRIPWTNVLMTYEHV